MSMSRRSSKDRRRRAHEGISNSSPEERIKAAFARLLGVFDEDFARISEALDPAHSAGHSRPKFLRGAEPLDTVARRVITILEESNRICPWLFLRGRALMRLTPDPSTGSIATEILSRASLRHEINKRTQWEILRPEGIAPLHISCPNDVVEHIWTDQGLPFPPLENITNTPVFDGRGELIVTPGYHAPCRTYFYSAPGFSIPPVPQNPSEADIEHAKTLLLDNVFIDFPYSDETQGAASRAHALALLLQSFVREFIQGPTPIYLVQKPAPGTGASLLESVRKIHAALQHLTIRRSMRRIMARMKNAA
jgi:putative DNA primase/helicase